MLARYHIKKDGTPGLCTAQVGNCPLGGDNQHYPTMEAAQAAADSKNANQYSGSKVVRSLVNEYTPAEFRKLTAKTRKIKKNLIEYANNFTENEYGVKLTIPIEVRQLNNSVDGRLRLYSDGTPYKISLDSQMVYLAAAENDDSHIKKLLTHELIHYSLLTQGKDYMDGSKTFEQELAKHDSVSSTATSKSEQVATATNVSARLKDVYTTTDNDGNVTNVEEYVHANKDYSSGPKLSMNGTIVSSKRTGIKLYKLEEK